jgi:hypothetical protein
MSKLRHAKPTLIIKLFRRLVTIFYVRGLSIVKKRALDVKRDHLICQNPQINARKICLRVAAVRRIRRPSR